MVIQAKDTANYPSTTPKELMQLLPIIEDANNHDPDVSISLFVHGKPGGSKTALIEQYCREHGRKFVKIVAPLMGVEVVQGFPNITFEEGVAKVQMAMLDILPTEEGPGWICIDELPQALPIAMSALTGIMYGGDLMHWKRRKGWHVYVTGNRMADKAASFRVPGQANNRVVHLELKQHVDDYSEWCLTREDRGGFDRSMVSWLRNNPEYLDGYDPELEASPTGRTIHMASAIQLQTKHPEHLRDILTAGALGEAAFANYELHRNRKKAFPTRPEILKDPEGCRMVTDPNDVHGMMNALAGGLTAEQAARVITYVERYSKDQVAVFVAEVRENAPTAVKTVAAVKALLQKYPE